MSVDCKVAFRLDDMKGSVMTENVVVGDYVRYSDRVCFGCGDLSDYCVSAVCADTLRAHENGEHAGCDILACAAADSDAYNRGVIR